MTDKQALISQGEALFDSAKSHLSTLIEQVMAEAKEGEDVLATLIGKAFSHAVSTTDNVDTGDVSTAIAAESSGGDEAESATPAAAAASTTAGDTTYVAPAFASTVPNTPDAPVITAEAQTPPVLGADAPTAAEAGVTTPTPKAADEESAS